MARTDTIRLFLILATPFVNVSIIEQVLVFWKPAAALTSMVHTFYYKDMRVNIEKCIQVLLCLSLLSACACSATPVIPAVTPAAQPDHVRKLGTRPYPGGGAIIFVVDQISDDNLGATADQIIRKFAENDAPLDVALAPTAGIFERESLDYWIPYIDAGIMDISLDGYGLRWLSAGTDNLSTAYADLRSYLLKVRGQFKSAFGDAPSAILLPAPAFNEINYDLLEQTGFSAVCSADSSTFKPSSIPVNWSGKLDLNGLYRLPITGKVDFSSPSPGPGIADGKEDPNSALLAAIRSSLANLDVAVIEIQPASFLGKDGRTDPAKIARLPGLIKSCGNLGELTTFQSWSGFSYDMMTMRPQQRPLPSYNGGPVIIFRMDDVSKGYLEDIDKELINIFKDNGVPVDCGVVAFANGSDTFDIPWLREYFNQGLVGISVHGYDWTYYQLDTTKELKSKKNQVDNPCITVTSSEIDTPRTELTYMYIRSILIRARAQYFKYYGVIPVAFTVPTDFFDETGYRAVDDAGFRVFSTQTVTERHPSSTMPVDYFGKYDPNGMYRIPTASDVCTWGDSCTWGDIFDVSRAASINGYCQYHNAYEDVYEYNDFTVMLCGTLEGLGVVAVGIHPSAFIDKAGKPDRAKLEKLEKIIKWCKSFATIMTFEQWYLHQTSNK